MNRQKGEGISRQTALWGMLLALAFVISYIERVIPSPVAAVPGMKLGLANSLVLVLLYLQTSKTAFSFNLLRIIAVGILFSGLWGMLYALAGGILSFICMHQAKKTGWFGLVGVSVLGGVSHNLGQIALAALSLQNLKLFYYFPALILAGVGTGALVGYITGHIIKRLAFLKTAQG